MEKPKGSESMIVVADTTPLISLMKMGKLKLLRQLFGEVQIPNAVYEELVSNPVFQSEAQQIQDSTFIKRVTVADEKSVSLLRRATGLDLGESEAIILSDTCCADLLLMDESKGRLVARQMGLHLMGTVGILKAAHEEGLLSYNDIEECITILKNHGRHISDRLYEQLLESIRH